MKNIGPVVILTISTSAIMLVNASRNDKWAKKYTFVAGFNIGVLVAIVLESLFD